MWLCHCLDSSAAKPPFFLGFSSPQATQKHDFLHTKAVRSGLRYQNGFRKASEYDSAGWSPMCYAAMNGDPVLMKALLEDGNPNEKTKAARPEAGMLMLGLINKWMVDVFLWILGSWWFWGNQPGQGQPGSVHLTLGCGYRSISIRNLQQGTGRSGFLLDVSLPG